LGSCRVEYPIPKIQSVAYLQHCVYGLPLIAQACHGYRVGGIPREASDGALVVNHADGHFPSSEAANDSQPLVVTANHDGTDWFQRRLSNGHGSRRSLWYPTDHAV